MSNEILIGAKISEGRRKKGLSQAQLADIMLVSAPAVSKWERGESMPDILTLNRLAAVFNTDLNYFMSADLNESDLFLDEKKNQAKSDRGENPLFGDRPSGDGGREEEKSEKTGRGEKSFDMGKWTWKNADFSRMENAKGRFSMANISGCIFAESKLSETEFTANKLVDCDFSGADLSGGKFKMTAIENNLFCDGNLFGASFSLCHIKNNDFSQADLSDTVFKGSNFSGNDISGAKLNFTEFKNCQIKDIDFYGEIASCSFINCAYKGVVFENVEFKNCFFKSRLKNVKFINCTADRTTYSFLINSKADTSGVTCKED